MTELNSAQLRTEAQQYTTLPQTELYAMLVSEEDRDGMAFSFGGLVARGKETFQVIWRDVGGSVCGYYRKHEKTVGNEIDVVVLVATALLGLPIVGGLNIVALSALIVKIGLGNLCVVRNTNDA